MQTTAHIRGANQCTKQPAFFISHPSTAQRGDGTTPRTVSTLIELELRGKNERVGVARRETKRLIYQFKVLGQPATSEVSSSDEK